MPFLSPPSLPEFLQARLPFGRRAYRLESGPYAGRLVHFLDHGPRAARPVLLLHGNPTWSFLWRKVMRRLPDLRCIAPDLVGLGLSDKPRRPADHRLDAHIEAVRELVRALELRQLVLVSQDWGGNLATGLAAREPAERVAAAVFGNCAVIKPHRWRGTSFHRFAHLPVVSDVVFRGLGFPLGFLHKAQGDPSSIRGETARAYRWPLRRLRDRAAPLGLARMVPDGPDHPSVGPIEEGDAWLRAFEGPVALVWGTKDPILGRALKRHQQALPNAPVTLTEAGHFLQEEVPEELAAAIRDVTARLASAAE